MQNTPEVSEIDQLNAYLESTSRGRWLVGDRLRVYVRRAKRVSPEGVTTDTLDIADVTAFQQGRHHFTDFLTEVERISPHALYIEEVGPEGFRNFFRKRGYAEVSRTEKASSFFFDPRKDQIS